MFEYQLELNNISKRYGNLLANHNLSLKIKPASIHALLGENGAGKSTLVNILYGLISRDQGQILWQGKAVQINSPTQAKQLGIGIVFQHFALFENLTVTENIALGINYQGSLKSLAKKILDSSAKYNLAVDPNAYVAQLSAGVRQRIEIIRCLLQQPSLLILDEPTSVLTEIEARQLLKTLGQLRDSGISILFISHKLDEIKALCDEATILRNGKLVASCLVADTDKNQLAQMMVGSKLADYAKRLALSRPQPLLTFRAQSKQFGQLAVADLTLKTGRILGIAGIAGNGQDELLSILAGESKHPHSQLEYQGRSILDWSVRRRNEAGLLYVPTERLGRSAIPNMTLWENSLLSVSGLSQFVRSGFIRKQPTSRFCRHIMHQFQVKADAEQALAGSLSGGNLQKFIVGRAILQKPRLLLIANPTWGVDIKAAIFIRNQLIKLRDQGVSILICSEDLDELMSLSDEIAVIRSKHLSDIYTIDRINREQIGQMMTQKCA